MSRGSRADRLAEEYALYGKRKRIKKERKKLTYATKLIIVLSLCAAIVCTSVTLMSLYFTGVFDPKPALPKEEPDNSLSVYEGFLDYKFDQNKLPKGTYAKITFFDGSKEYTVQAYLFDSFAPNTVANFKTYANRGYYNGKVFGEVTLGYDSAGNADSGKIICGGYKRNANGELTYELPQNAKTIPGEFLENGFSKNILSNTAGVIGMTHGVSNDDAITDFYILPYDDLSLNGRYAAFAKVTDSVGLGVIRAMARKAYEDKAVITIKEITTYEKK